MTRWRPPFANPTANHAAFYDLIDDYGLIEASFAQQYGIRLRLDEAMSWDEFTTLLAGINGDTPLGRIVSIRSETDRERLKRFTPEEKRIRNEWARRHRRIVTDEKERDAAMAGFLSMFKAMAGGGG